MLLWLCKVIKVTSGFNLKKTNFFARWHQHPQNSWNIFQIQITPLFRRPQGPQGCLEKQNHPLSSNLVVWCAKIGPKTKKLWKTIIFCCFSNPFWSFLEILASRPNFSAPNYQTTKFPEPLLRTPRLPRSNDLKTQNNENSK